MLAVSTFRDKMMKMPPFRNLHCDSYLVNCAIDYLISVGGSASSAEIIGHVMNISNADPTLTSMLMSDIAGRDPRLAIDVDHVVYIEPDHSHLDLETAGFVVFDLETTGAKAPPCRITEIGAYRVKDGRIVDEFKTLVNPESEIPPFITSLTGINQEMVKDAPVFRDICGDLLEFIDDSVLVAHNARFDMAFLDYEIGRVHADYRLANPSLCTVQLSRRILPDIENHKLNTVADHYSIELLNHHRATDDARATAQIFVNLLEAMMTRGIRNLGAAKKFSYSKGLC